MLEPIWDISQTDFAKLRDTFLEKSLKKKDIYQTSHPQELSKFQEFLQQCKPYDIVVDGLNVAWMRQGGRPDTKLVSDFNLLTQDWDRSLKIALRLGKSSNPPHT